MVFRSNEHARQIYRVWNINVSDPAVFEYMLLRMSSTWPADAMMYPLFFLTCMVSSISAVVFLRNVAYSPDVAVRMQDKRRPMLDRDRQPLFSLPYYNHRLRNVCAKHRADYVDNEPDYASGPHKWSLRPTRTQDYQRVFGSFSTPKYFVDDPKFEPTLHESMEKFYAEFPGYKTQTDEPAESDE